LQVTQPSDTLSFLLHGNSSALDAIGLLEGIRVKLAGVKGAKTVLFDLCDINPVFNTAGRIFDIALHFAPDLADRGIVTIIKMPWDIYEELQRTDDLPPPAETISFAHVEIRLSKSSTFPSTPMPPIEPILAPAGSTFLMYTGEIIELTEDMVSVSLFPSAEDGEEIAGEFDRRQFPEGTLAVGQTFHYRAIAKEPGRTEVKITPIEEISLHSDDLLDIWNEVSARIPDDENAR
jgi:hypothetical protein